jgi:hypothetical protein
MCLYYKHDRHHPENGAELSQNISSFTNVGVQSLYIALMITQNVHENAKVIESQNRPVCVNNLQKY